MKYLKFKFNGKKPAKIVFLGDVHHGSIYSDTKAFEATLEKIKKDKNIKIILMGDLIENASANSVGSGVYEQTMNPSKQVKDMVVKLKPFEKQILYSHRGNHEERSFRFDGFDIGETMADSLGVPYIRNMCICDIEVGKILYRIYTWHGHGSSQMTTGRIKILQRQAETVEADVYCFSDDTEILTQRGWKNIKNTSIDDKIYTLNTKTNIIEEDNILDKIESNNNELYNFENKNINMSITKNHRILYKQVSNRKGKKYNHKYLFKSAEEFAKMGSQVKIPLAGVRTINDNLNYSDDEIKLTGWLISEGHFRKTQNLIQISQKSGTKKSDEIDDILTNLKYKFSKKEQYTNGLTMDRYNIFMPFSKQIRKKLVNNKNIPKWAFSLSNRQFKLFLNSLIDGDGSRSSKNSCVYYSKSKKIINDLQALCTINGYRTKIYSRKHGFSNTLQHSLIICNRQTTDFAIGKDKITITPTTQKQWCVSTKNTTVIVRRKGIPFISGNCMGHVHELFDTTLPKREVVKGGFEDIFRHYILTGAYLKWDESYAEQNGYRMVKMGSPLLILYNKQKNSTVDLTWCK